MCNYEINSPLVKDIISDSDWKKLSTQFIIVRHLFTDKFYHKKSINNEEEANKFYQYISEFNELFLILRSLINKYYDGKCCIEYPFDHSIPNNFSQNKFKSTVELYRIYKIFIELAYNTLRYKFECDDDFQKLIELDKKITEKILNNIKQGYID